VVVGLLLVLLNCPVAVAVRDVAWSSRLASHHRNPKRVLLLLSMASSGRPQEASKQHIDNCSTMPFASIFFKRHSIPLLFVACFVVVQLIAPVKVFQPLSVAHSKRTTAKHTVFYNIYVSPSDQSLAAQGIRIIHEQLEQVAKSYAAKRQWNDQSTVRHPLDVLYVTIGAANISETVVQPDCKALELNCVHLGHFKAAHEEKALGALHRFCTDKSKKQVERSVIYVHTKGSFNQRKGTQEELRRASTAAVTSELCLQSLEQHKNNSLPSTRQCNACGLLFQPLPTLHFPGNFFSAKCSYISQLLTPHMFKARANYLKERNLVLRASGTKHGNFYRWSSSSIGLGRYAYERKCPPNQSLKNGFQRDIHIPFRSRSTSVQPLQFLSRFSALLHSVSATTYFYWCKTGWVLIRLWSLVMLPQVRRCGIGGNRLTMILNSLGLLPLELPLPTRTGIGRRTCGR
jgi:hypothetical protein